MKNPALRNHLLAYVFFFAVAVLITWPLVTVMGTHFAGYDFGDAHEMTRHIWWFKYAAQHGQPLIFQPLLGYPDGMQGVILWSDPLQFFPGWLFAFFMPLPAAYNLQALLNLALNGWAAYFLVWKLLNGQRLPALLAGVVFLAAPTIQGHLAGGHGGLLVQWPLPLYAWALLSLRVTSRQPSAISDTTEGNTSEIITRNSELGTRNSILTLYSVLCTLYFVLLPFGHTLQLIYAAFPLTVLVALTFLAKRDWRALLRLTVSVGAGMVILGVFLIPVFSATFGTSAYTDEGGGVTYSMDALGLVTPSFDHPLYGQLEYTHRVLGTNNVEGSSYVGIIAGVLAVIGLVKRRESRWWLLLAAVAAVLALGPLLKIFDQPISLRNAEYTTFVTLPWALLADLPGFSLARTPGRFNFLIALAVAVLAAYGLSALLSAFSRQPSATNDQHEPEARNSELGTRNFLSTLHLAPSTLVFLILAALILFDYQSFWPLPTYSAEIPQPVHDLAARDDVRAVFDLPWDNLLAAKDSLWLQTAHEKPIIAGQVTRRTPVSPAKLTILEQTLDPALLNEAGADVVILHKTYDYEGELGTLAREKLGAPTYEDAHLAMWETPEKPADQEFIVFDDTRYLPSDSDLSVYLYVPEPGWVLIPFDDRLPFPRETNLFLDLKPIKPPGFYDYYPDPEHPPYFVPHPMQLFIETAGFHTITISLNPSCPSRFPGILTCEGIRFGSPANYTEYLPGYAFTPIPFDRGVTLHAAYIPSLMRRYQSIDEVVADTGWDLSLWWQFDQPLTDQDVRFIKVLDEQNNQVVGYDNTLGAQAAGDQQLETLELGIPQDISPGDYRICVGWYSHPDLNRFAVLSDVPGAGDGLACISEFTVPER